MSKLISGYWWAWRETEAGKKSMQTLRKFYPDADLFINVDYEGDVEGYQKVGEELGATVTRNNFQLGYCGNFGDRDIGYEHWTKEKAVEWLRGVYEACKKTDSKYIMLFTCCNGNRVACVSFMVLAVTYKLSFKYMLSV